MPRYKVLRYATPKQCFSKDQDFKIDKNTSPQLRGSTIKEKAI